MKHNIFTMPSVFSTISIITDKEYRLTVDLQWYGIENRKFYSFLLASDHSPKDATKPPFYLLGFCLVEEKIIPLNLIESNKAITKLVKILDEYDLDIKGLNVNKLKRIKIQKRDKVGKSSFITPVPFLKILFSETFEPPVAPGFNITWGAFEKEITNVSRVVGKEITDYLQIIMDFEFNSTLRNLDYRDDLKLFIKKGARKELIFTSYPVEVIPISEEKVLIKAGSFGEELRNQKMSHLSIKDCQAGEVFYLISRMGGIASQNIKIQGHSIEGHSVYTAIFPIDNLILESKINLGFVEFNCGFPESETDYFLEHLDTMKKLNWEHAFVTARVHVSANSFYDAYLLASEQIEKSLDIISHFSRQSTPFNNYSSNKIIYKWDRNKSTPIPKRLPLALIINDTKGGNVLIDWTKHYEPKGLEGNYLIDLLNDAAIFYEDAIFWGDEPNKHNLESLLKSLVRSLRWLRLSWEAESIIDKLIFVSTALEFAVVGIDPQSFLEKEDTKLIVNNAIETLKETKKSQYNQDTYAALKQKIANSLTNPPLMAKVNHAIKSLNIAISESDLFILKKVREQRNKVLHGGNEQIVTKEELEKVHSIVSRIVSMRIMDIREKIIKGIS